jgi:hypothetical protein
MWSCVLVWVLLAAPAAAARTLLELPVSTGRSLLGASDHVYKVHEKVALYANKVGPFHNPRCGLALRTDTLSAASTHPACLEGEPWVKGNPSESGKPSVDAGLVADRPCNTGLVARQPSCENALEETSSRADRRSLSWLRAWSGACASAKHQQLYIECALRTGSTQDRKPAGARFEDRTSATSQGSPLALFARRPFRRTAHL